MSTTFEGSVPITTEHLQKMAAKLAEAMQGLWAIIEDHGTDDMKKYRDEHLGALGIRMNLGEGCGTCPACMAEKEGPIAAAKKKEEQQAKPFHFSESGTLPDMETCAKLLDGLKKDTFDA